MISLHNIQNINLKLNLYRKVKVEFKTFMLWFSSIFYFKTCKYTNKKLGEQIYKKKTQNDMYNFFVLW